MEEVLGAIAEVAGEVLSVIIEAFGLRVIIAILAIILVIVGIVYFN